MVRILVIDDSKFQRTFAKLMLEEKGYEVIEAENGTSGLELIQSESPDCVLLDFHMPDLSGADVLDRLKEAGSKVPVIVVTADEGEWREDCLARGAADVVDKPRDGGELANAIESALNP